VGHIRVDYPNGDHQSHKLTTGSDGKGTYSYTQGASKITHRKAFAHVTVTSAAGASSVHSYKISFGNIDVSAEPRGLAVGKMIDVWVHTKAHTRVAAYLLFPNKKFAKLPGNTNAKGWADVRYRIGSGLTTAKNHKVTVLARLASGKPNFSTKTTFTIT
jgi:hypothetical protein